MNKPTAALTQFRTLTKAARVADRKGNTEKAQQIRSMVQSVARLAKLHNERWADAVR